MSSPNRSALVAESLGASFWEVTGKQSRIFNPTLEFVYGDVVAAGLMESGDGDAGLVVARRYEVSDPIDQMRIWRLSKDAIDRIASPDDPVSLQSDTIQLAVDIAAHLRFDTAMLTDPNPGEEHVPLGWVANFVNKYRLTGAEFLRLLECAGALADLPPIPFRRRIAATRLEAAEVGMGGGASN